MSVVMKKAKSFSLSAYIEQALRMAEYEKDENGVVVASVPNIPGFYSQGENFEEARNNLRDAIEGNLLVALQLGFEIPEIAGVEMREVDYAEAYAAQSE
jgi:predicted RNase H-like HicB family nuclease